MVLFSILQGCAYLRQVGCEHRACEMCPALFSYLLQKSPWCSLSLCRKVEYIFTLKHFIANIPCLDKRKRDDSILRLILCIPYSILSLWKFLQYCSKPLTIPYVTHYKKQVPHNNNWRLYKCLLDCHLASYWWHGDLFML